MNLKNLALIAATLLLPLYTIAAPLDCNSNWPVAVKKNSYGELLIRIDKNLIQKHKYTGGSFLGLQLTVGPKITEIRSETLLALFAAGRGAQQFLPLGQITATQKISGGICYQVQLAEDIKISEYIKRKDDSCFVKLLDGCRSSGGHYLKFKKSGFLFSSQTGVTKN